MNSARAGSSQLPTKPRLGQHSVQGPSERRGVTLGHGESRLATADDVYSPQGMPQQQATPAIYENDAAGQLGTRQDRFRSR